MCHGSVSGVNRSCSIVGRCCSPASALAAQLCGAGVDLQPDDDRDFTGGRVIHNWSVSTGAARQGSTPVVVPGAPNGSPATTAPAATTTRRCLFRSSTTATSPFHGTDQISRLGTPASAGCIRLHPSNAARLFRADAAGWLEQHPHRRPPLKPQNEKRPGFSRAFLERIEIAQPQRGESTIIIWRPSSFGSAFDLWRSDRPLRARALRSCIPSSRCAISRPRKRRVIFTLITFLEEPPHGPHLHLISWVSILGRIFDFLDLDGLLPLAGFGSLFLALVFQLAEVGELAHRGLLIGRDLHEIKAGFLSQFLSASLIDTTPRFWPSSSMS